MSAIDDACRALRALAKKEGGVILLDIRGDGRVRIARECERGYEKWVLQCDVEPGGALPLPSVALAKRGDS